MQRIHGRDPAPAPAVLAARHLLVDAWDAPAAGLDDPATVRSAVEAAVTAAGATLIELCVHRFSPQGVTAVATLAESHLVVHTWPERGFLAADLLYCGGGDPTRAVDALVARLGAREVRVRQVLRGPGAPSAGAGAGNAVPAVPAGSRTG